MRRMFLVKLHFKIDSFSRVVDFVNPTVTRFRTDGQFSSIIFLDFVLFVGSIYCIISISRTKRNSMDAVSIQFFLHFFFHFDKISIKIVIIIVNLCKHTAKKRYDEIILFGQIYLIYCVLRFFFLFCQFQSVIQFLFFVYPFVLKCNALEFCRCQLVILINYSD